MPYTLDIFNHRAFSVLELTEAINVVPNTYGRLNELNLFPEKPVATTLVGVEIKNGVLNLIPSRPRGGDANLNQGGKRELRYFALPHIPLEDRVLAEEVQNLRAFGRGESELAPVMELVNERLLGMAAKHAITLEWLRAGALKGKVLDADGGVILDIFAEFGVSEKVVDFALDEEATDVAGKVKEVSRHIEDGLLGDAMSRVHCLCGETFFDRLAAHPTVKEAYAYQQGLNPLRNDLRKGFEFQGVVFEEYRGQAATADGTAHRFIAADEARFFPLGTLESFRTYLGPADFMETVNTAGRRLYAKLAPDQRYNRFVDLHTQSNPLPICLRPALLVKGTA